MIGKKVYELAKKEGRICSNCHWIVTKKDWKKGHKLCGNCRVALKGVNTKYGASPYSDDIPDKTGEMQ